jgi:hypothetical protein
MDLGKLNISAEDRFVIVQLNVEKNTLPYGETLDNLAYIFSTLSPKYQIVCDFRSIDNITNDLIDFLREFKFNNSQVLLDKRYVSVFRDYVSSEISLFPVDNYETKFHEHEVNLTVFADQTTQEAYFKEFNSIFSEMTNRFKGLPSEEEYILFMEREGFNIDKNPLFKNYRDYLTYCKSTKSGIFADSGIIISRRYILDLINNIGRSSLLDQYCLLANRDGSIIVDSFQANTINDINAKDQLITAKPYVRSNISYELQNKALCEFQSLINNNNVKETQLQKFFEKNPIFFQSMGYKNIKPQIILEREEGDSLRPDFLLQPFGEEWWDILDLKLPNKKTVISSKRDRYKFFESLNELIAQLREYAAYFENEKYAKRIEEKYGIKCYKPRIIGVIGNDNNEEDERQIRRLMTSYSDLKIIPFNQLYKICKERILI